MASCCEISNAFIQSEGVRTSGDARLCIRSIFLPGMYSGEQHGLDRRGFARRAGGEK